MSSDEINIQFMADIDDLTSKLNSAAEAASGSMDKIAESAATAGDALGESIARGVKESTAHLETLEKEVFSIGESFEHLHGQITEAFEVAGLALAYEAFEKIGEALEKATENATELNNESELLELTVEQYQALQEAAKEAGVNISIVARTAIRLKEDFAEAGKGVSEAIDKLRTLGFTQEQISSGTMDMNAALNELGNKLRDSSTATETMDAITKTFGSRAALVALAIKGYDGNAESLARRMEELNGLSKAQSEKLHEIHKEMAQLGTETSNTTSKFVLFGVAFLKAIGDAQVSEEDFAESAREATKAQEDMAEAAKATAVEVSSASAEMQKAAVTNAKEEIALTKSGTEEKVVAVARYVAAVADYYGIGSDAYKKALTEETKAGMEYAEKQENDAIERQEREARAFSKYVHAKEEIVSKSVNEMLKDAEKYFKEQDKYDEAVAKGAEQAAVAQEKSAEKILDAQNKSKQITPADYATAFISTIRQIEEAEVQMYEQQLRNARDNVADVQKAQNEIAAAHLKATAEIQAKDMEAAEEYKKNWEAAIKPISTAFVSGLDGMLKGTETFREAVTKTFDKLALDFINSTVSKMVTGWATAEAQKIAATEAGNNILTALGLQNLIASKAVDSTQAISDITTKAAQAAAGAFAATAAIPYVGPVLAPAAAAEAEASVMAFTGQIASAAGGWQVSSDQMAMVHEDEMILPAHISKGIQERISDPTEREGNQSSGGTNHYHIDAHDAKSFEKYVNSARNRGTIAKALKMAQKRGNSSLRM